MTIDDESSIYVGGLPYDATEDSIRGVFDLYGAVVAVKIINDHSTRGKCYGFVTFTNPRSAIDAINDMDGRTVDGRVVRVNKVNSRGGRSNIDKESFRRDIERGPNWDKDRGREREFDRGRYRYRDRDSNWSRERNISRDRSLDRERRRDHARDHDQAREDLLDKDMDRGQDKGLENNEQECSLKHNQEWEKEHDLNWNQDRKIDGTNGYETRIDMDKDQQERRQNGLSINRQPTRDLSSDSSDECNHQVKELDRSTQRLEELKKETSEMEEMLAEKGKLVVDLQKTSQKLEDALVTAKKRSSYHQMQLMKLHKCFRQLNDYTERLKSNEQELQTLVESTMLESDGGEDIV